MVYTTTHKNGEMVCYVGVTLRLNIQKNGKATIFDGSMGKSTISMGHFQ